MQTIEDPLSSTDPSALKSWAQLSELANQRQQGKLSSYFDQNPDRYQQLSYSAAGINANLSRQHIDQAVLSQLLTLASDMQLPAAIKAIQQGQEVNFTEGRAALHSDLRSPSQASAESSLTTECLKKMDQICQLLLSQQWRGYSNHKITDIVSIGIGGSDLGPRMITESLTPYHNGILKLHFVTNVDPCDLENTLKQLEPESTLFIVISKSWNTLETLTNAESAKQWFIDNTRQTDISQHFIGITARTDRCCEFGINKEHILPMWDWVGGRFSLWSAAGLPIALATSFETFEALLQGAQEMDEHFFSCPLQNNLPTILALLEIWYVNFWGCGNVAVLPYDHTLRLLPNHLQQLAMESNGKSIDRAGNNVNYSTAPVLWGSAGTIGQHSFHQLLHQGTQLIPVDFILPLKSHSGNQEQHNHMIANCLAQAQTLMDGQSFDDVFTFLTTNGVDEKNASLLAKHKQMPANRPSTIISFDKLTPATLGALTALYEHKTFAASIIWNINAFDQWGVELGKTTSQAIYENILNGDNTATNQATKTAIQELLNKS